MKIRHGFVSNSSSSSFLIAVKIKESPSKSNTGLNVSGIDLLDHLEYINRHDSENTRVKETGIKGCLDQICDSYGNESETFKEAKELINNKKINDGKYRVALIEISYNDNLTNRLYEFLLKKKQIIQIMNFN